jgi:hypothetical protein
VACAASRPFPEPLVETREQHVENWIGVVVWAVLGMLIGMAMRLLVKLPEETSGHAIILAVIGGFGAVVGGMLGVGIFHLQDPAALSLGGMGGAIALAVLMAWVYRWGTKGLI